MKVETTPGFALDVEIAGHGPALVMLHGFTGSGGSWGDFGELLAGSFTTVRIDIVGHGRSDAPATLDHYRMPRVASDLVAAVAKAGFDRAHWLGYSMGGRTALHVAAAHPGAVERMVLIGASPGIADRTERETRVAADESLARRIEDDGIEAFVDHWENIPLFASQRRRLPDPLRARIRAGRLACGTLGLANSLRGMGAGAQEPLHQALAGIDLPTLWLAGSEDSKYMGNGASMAAAMPRARFLAVTGAGHAAQVEQPEFCAGAITAFLREGEQ